MNPNEEIVFKIPIINSEENNNENETKQMSAEELQEKVSKPETVSKTVIPEPMTRLVPPEGQYFVDQLKNGVIVGHNIVAKSRLVFGRAQDCDIILEHPSISRYHSVLLWSPLNDEQFRSGQNKQSFWYLVDCGSTHGTNCNKTQITAGKLIKLIPNNNVFKFGASTRLFSLGSNVSDNDEEEDHIDERHSPITKSIPNPKSIDEGCNWGINEEQIEEKAEQTADSKSLQAIIAAMKSTGTERLQTDNSNAYLANPNKSIQQWFEREGYDLDFKCDSIHNKFKCTIDLPIDGQWIPIEGSLMHRKKEAITDACLKCCQLLDRAGLLFPWQQKSKTFKRKTDDMFDSDDDMIDETVDFSHKKLRKVSETNDSSNVDNYDTLNKKWSQINEELCLLRVKLANIGLKLDERTDTVRESADSLDNFMATIGRTKYGLSMNDKIEKSNVKMKINVLVKEQQKLEKLIKLTKPSVHFEAIPQQNVSELESNCLNIVSTTTAVNQTTQDFSETNEQNDSKNIESERKDDIKRKTELIIKELKDSAKPKSIPNIRSKQRIKAQSIVDAIENEKKLEKNKQNVDYDNDYVDWLPPTDQSGDGKTPLNQRLGY